MLPMFPLGCTLLPGGRLPLHVFEDRYRTLVRDVLADGSPEFGVVLIERGSEVGGGDVRSNRGTVARVLQCRRFADGRYALVVGGTTRFAVESWSDAHPYPSAAVRLLTDDGQREEVVASIDRLRRAVRSVVALAVECGTRASDLEMTITGDPLMDVWRLIDASPLGHHDRQALLAIDDVSVRCHRFEELLDDTRAALMMDLLGEG